MAATPALRVYQSNNRLLEMRVTETDVDGNTIAYDLTGCEVKVYIKRRAKDTDPTPINGTITDAVNGLAEVFVDTGTPRSAWLRVDVIDTVSNRVVTVYANNLLIQAA